MKQMEISEIFHQRELLRIDSLRAIEVIASQKYLNPDSLKSILNHRHLINGLVLCLEQTPKEEV
jgi:hypothetical protein